MSKRVTAVAHARVGLLGNPSDGYGGKALAFSLGNFDARVTLEPAEAFLIEAGDRFEARRPNIAQAWFPLDQPDTSDASRLIHASLRRLRLRFPELEQLPEDDPRLRMRVRCETDIPREVGLAGSSAIVIACLRAFLAWFERALSDDEIAQLALAAEVAELGIAAGPMDRIIQCHEGFMWMDFGTPGGLGQLPLEWLPPMFVAWDPQCGEASGVVHSDVRARFERGDADVREAMAVFPQLVDAGIACLEREDHAGFAKLVDRNFDTRASIWTLTPRYRALVAIGRAGGHAVKQTGSGGAVVGVLRNATDFLEVERAYREAGYCAIRPEFVAART